LWWGLREGFDGVFVYQSPHANPLQLSYVRDFLALVGLSDRVLIAEDWLRFPVVHVPEAAHRFNAHIAPEFQIPFQRAADAARAKAGPDLPAKLYVSRSRLDSARIIGEEIVEEMFAAEGYRVIHPQTLPLAEQVALFNAATSVAGFIGSAMHNIVFSRGGIEVTCIARDAKIGESYLLIDQLLGNDGTYLVAKSADRTGLIGRHEPFLLDIDALAATLRAAGRIGPDNRPSYSKRRLKRDFEAERNYQLASNRRSPHPPLRRLGLTLKAIALRPFWAPPWKILPQRLYRALTSARR